MTRDQYTYALVFDSDGTALIGTLDKSTGKVKDLEKATDRLGDSQEKTAKKADRLQDRLSGLRKSASSVLKGLAGVATIMTGALGIGFGVGISKTIDWGDKLDKLNLRLGVSTEALSEYAHVAELSGVQFDAFTTSLQRQQRRVAEAAKGQGEARDALRELGLEAKALAELAPEHQFEIIAKRLNETTSELDRSRIAMKLWDTEGVALLQITNQGSDAIARMRQEARDLGLTMDRETATNMAAAKDEITRVQGAFEGLTLQLAQHFGPELRSIMGFVSDQVIPGFKQMLREIGLVDSSLSSYSTSELEEGLRRALDERDRFVEIQGTTFRQWTIGSDRLREKIDEANFRVAQFRVELAKTQEQQKQTGSSAESLGDVYETVKGKLVSVRDLYIDHRDQLVGVGDEVQAYVTALRLQTEELGLTDVELVRLEGQRMAAAAANDVEREAIEKATEAYVEAREELDAYTESEKQRAEALKDAETLWAKVVADWQAEIDAKRESHFAGQELVDSLEQELRLLQLSDEEREVEIALRGLSAEAAAEQRERVTELIAEIRKQREENELLAKQADPFAESWLAALDRMDAAGVDMWENFLRTGEISMDSVKDIFLRMLAEMIHAATTQQILLSFGLGGQGGGSLGTSGGFGQILSGFTGGGGGGFWNTISGLFSGGGGGATAAQSAYVASNVGVVGFDPATGAPIFGSATNTGGFAPAASSSGSGGLFSGFNGFQTGGGFSAALTGAGIGALVGQAYGLIPLDNGWSPTSTTLDAFGIDTSNPTIQSYSETGQNFGAIAGGIVGSIFLGPIGAAIGAAIGGAAGRLKGAIFGDLFGNPDGAIPRIDVVNNQLLEAGQDPGEFGRESALGVTIQGQQITNATGSEVANQYLDAIQGFDQAIADELSRLGLFDDDLQQRLKEALLGGPSGETHSLFTGEFDIYDILNDRLGDLSVAFSEGVRSFMTDFGDGTLEGDIAALVAGAKLEEMIADGILEGFSLDGLGEFISGQQLEGEAMLDTLLRVVSITEFVTENLGLLGFEMQGLNEQTLAFSTTLIDSLGGAQAAQGTFNRVFNSLFSDQERAQLVYDQMKDAASTTFDTIGLSIDDYLGSGGVDAFKQLFMETWPTLSAEAAADWLQAAEALGILTDATSDLAGAFGTPAELVSDFLSRFGTDSRPRDFAAEIALVEDAMASAIEDAITLGASEEELAQIREAGAASIAQIREQEELARQGYADFMAGIREETGLLTSTMTEREVAEAQLERQYRDMIAQAGELARASGEASLSLEDLAALQAWYAAQMAAIADEYSEFNAQIAIDTGSLVLSSDTASVSLNRTANAFRSLDSSIGNSAEELRRLKEALRQSLIDEDFSNLSPLTIEEQFLEQQGIFNATVEAALAGDQEAAARLPEERNRYLQLAEQMFSTASTEFATIFGATRDIIQEVIDSLPEVPPEGELSFVESFFSYIQNNFNTAAAAVANLGDKAQGTAFVFDSWAHSSGEATASVHNFGSALDGSIQVDGAFSNFANYLQNLVIIPIGNGDTGGGSVIIPPGANGALVNAAAAENAGTQTDPAVLNLLAKQVEAIDRLNNRETADSAELKRGVDMLYRSSEKRNQILKEKTLAAETYSR